MFHVILALLHVVGFEGYDLEVSEEVGGQPATEGRVAHVQASFFLNSALATYMSIFIIV